MVRAIGDERAVTTLTIDLLRNGNTVSGRVTRYGGSSHPFASWVTLFALLDRLLDQEKSGLRPTVPGEPLDSPPGSGRTPQSPRSACTVLHGGVESGGAYSAQELVVPPGGEEPAHVYPDQDLGLYVVEGEGVLQLGSDSVVGRSGDFFNVPRGCLYSFRNGGADPARVLLTLVPAGAPAVKRAGRS